MSFINRKLILFFFLISLLNISFQSQEFSIFFNKNSFLTSIEDTQTMRSLQYNKIFITSKIAIPNQNLKFYLRFNEYITYITNNSYQKSESTSYEFIRKKNDGKESEFIPLDFKTESLKSGYESKEIVKFDDNIINDFYFILADKTNNKDDSYESIIGLNLPEKVAKPLLLNTNIFEQLKNNNFINKRIFSIFYFNEIRKEKNRNDNKDNDGIIIFGKLPHELKNDKKNSDIFKRYYFNDNNLNWANTEAGDYHKKWKIKFDYILFANEQLQDLIAEFIIEQNFFTGTSLFKEKVHKYFFDEFISKKICKEDKFYNYMENFNYYFYSCENSIETYFDKYKDGILIFTSKNLNEQFNFNLEELFFRYNNKFYFGIIFDEYQMHGWKLGRLFFEKYPLVFSLDNKAIGYYKQIRDNKKRNSSTIITFFLILLILMLLLLLIIGFKKYTFLKSLIPRRLKANELDDEYIYSNGKEIKKEITTEMAMKISNNSISSLGY